MTHVSEVLGDEPAATIHVEVSGWFTDIGEAKFAMCRAISDALHDGGHLRWSGLGISTRTGEPAA